MSPTVASFSRAGWVVHKYCQNGVKGKGEKSYRNFYVHIVSVLRNSQYLSLPVEEHW